MARDSTETRLVAQNKKARHKYLILDTLECGVRLLGTEVKSLRAGGCSIAEAFARIEGGELWLHGATIGEYSHGNIHNHKPARVRKLLANRREITKWEKRVREKGVTLVPLAVYFRGHLVKVELALVSGKKLYDKREDQKKRDAKRDMDRARLRRR